MKNTTMKIVPLFIAGVLLSACGQTRYPDSLIAADSLTYVNPDSALNLLKSIEKGMEQSKTDVKMYYRLLCIKAKDKAFMIHKTDTGITEILDYYKNDGDRHILPEAYYYAGRVSADLGDAPRALDYYEKSLSLLGDCHAEKDFMLKGKIHSQMAELFTYQGLYDDALANIRIAYEHDAALKDTTGMLYSLGGIANVYRHLEHPEKSIHFLEKANEIAVSTNSVDEQLTAMIQSQLASAYYAVGRFEDTKRLAIPAAESHNEVYAGAAYIILADIYRNMGDIDSALIYYNRILDVGNIYIRKSAYYRLSQIELSRRHPEKATEYLERFFVCFDSVSSLKNAETVKRMHSLYNYRLWEIENAKLNVEGMKKSRLLWGFASMLVTGIFIFLAYYFYSKSRRMKREREFETLRELQEKKYRESKSFIEECQIKNEKLEHELAEVQETNSALYEELKVQKSNLEYQLKMAEAKREYEEQAKKEFFSSSFYKNLSAGINRGLSLTDEEWEELYRKTDVFYPRFVEELRGLCSQITDVEQKVCLLVKLGISNKCIATALSLQGNSISSIRSRLFQKTFGRKGTPKEWNEVIRSL